MKAPEMYRQGDVLLVKVGEVPKGAKQEPRADRIVLAYGEVTGHAHAVATPVGDEAAIWTAEGERFLQTALGGPTMLRHEEHDPIALPPGVYKVGNQREYTPEAIRNVAD